MREVGVEGPFGAPDLGYAFSHLDIHSDCEKRLLDIELDLRSSVCTFEAVKWAIATLRRIELEEHYFVPEDVTSLASIARPSAIEQIEKGRGSTRGKIFERLAPRLQPALSDQGNRSVTGRDAGSASPSSSKLRVEVPETVDVQVLGNIFKVVSGGKRKSDEEASGHDVDKRARVTDVHSLRACQAGLIEADGGEAGRRMAERINSRLAIPECIFLTNLISHCLLVSMDQAPTRGIQEALASLCLNDTTTADSSKESVSSALPASPHGHARSTSESGEWMWLHKWLVRTILSDSGDDGHFASLDWLVAFMTATRTTIIRPILDDLAWDLRRREKDGAPTLASYMRRTGVLEYAALRDPERTFGIIYPLFPPGVFPTPQWKAEDGELHQGHNELWQGWLGLMVLCPRLFSSFSQLWVPTLSADVVKSWRIACATTSLPAIRTLLADTENEEPRTKREWFCAAMLRRLPQLAPVASSVAVLLSGLDDSPTDHGTLDDDVGFGNYLLDSVYKELSKHVLPKVLGSGQYFCREVLPADKLGGDSGVILFMENLTEHSHVLWRKALEYYSTSKCSCCEVPHPDVLLESTCRTEAGNDGVAVKEQSQEGSDMKSKHERGGQSQRGCMYKDPLIQLCHLSLLCCTEQAVADLLADASSIRPCSIGLFEAQSLRKLLMVMRVMRIVSGQGRGTLVLELWGQLMTNHVTVASNEQALLKVLAIRQLLDPVFWQNHLSLLGSSQFVSAIPVTAAEDAVGHQSLSWKLVWKVLHRVVDGHWLHILPLLHRDGAWELRLAVLGVLQLLSPDGTSRPQVVADRLKAVLGIFFSWLEMSDASFNRSAIEQGGSKVPRWRWQFARAIEHLKSIIIELASSSFPSFTLMVNSLLDFSFEHNIPMSTIPSPSSHTNPLLRLELSASSQRTGTPSRSSLYMAPLSTGRLDRYGRLVLASEPSPQLSSTRQSTEMKLTDENCRIQSGAVTSLHMYEKERVSGFSEKVSAGQNAASSVSTTEKLRKDLIRRTKVFEAELGSLLRRTLERAISQHSELLALWPCHPVSVMTTLLANRLETPHEVSMTMEQYEEVLPKHISSLRHIFLMDCFSQNPLLMEMVELIVKHGENREVLTCVEFVRVLLAESISRWHSAFRTRWPHTLPPAKVSEEEAWNRMQVNRLIQLVASANWLPQPLAASGEIVAVIDGADIADLLLLVWRCMHHAMAFGSKGWGGSSSNLHATGASTDDQAISTGSGVDEEAGKEGTYTEWESHFFAILRHNVSQIGAHFAQVYPIRKAF